jgi:hypothetical protein
MRHWTNAYSAIAIWTFGWLAARFGLLPSLFAAMILFSPILIAWRMRISKREINRREYFYLGVVALLAVCGTSFVVSKWVETGMDRSALFEREFHQFKNSVSSMPEYTHVEVSFTLRKGGRVYLHGHVPNKSAHDRLLHTYERMVRNNLSGCYDGVEYPGKSTEKEVISPE